MNKIERNEEKEELRKERPVDMDFLSCDEAPHFFGYEIERAVNQGLDYIPVHREEQEGGLPFHCEISLYQEDEKDGTYCCFRYINARIKHGEIVDWDTDGIPDEMEDHFRERVLIMYRVMYPNGLTVEMMRK